MLVGILLDKHQIRRISQIKRVVRIRHFVGEVVLAGRLCRDFIIRLGVVWYLMLPQTLLTSLRSIRTNIHTLVQTTKWYLPDTLRIDLLAERLTGRDIAAAIVELLALVDLYVAGHFLCSRAFAGFGDVQVVVGEGGGLAGVGGAFWGVVA